VVRLPKLKEKPTSFAFFPYVQTTYDRLSRVLAKHNIRCVVDLLHRKITSLLCLVKNDLGLRNSGVYSIPC